MSRYDGLIIPRSYSEYINKTDAATLQQALQLSGVLSEIVAAGDNKAVTSNAVNSVLASYCKCTTVEITTNASGAIYSAGNIPVENIKNIFVLDNENYIFQGGKATTGVYYARLKNITDGSNVPNTTVKVAILY